MAMIAMWFELIAGYLSFWESVLFPPLNLPLQLVIEHLRSMAETIVA